MSEKWHYEVKYWTSYKPYWIKNIPHLRSTHKGPLKPWYYDKNDTTFKLFIALWEWSYFSDNYKYAPNRLPWNKNFPHLLANHRNFWFPYIHSKWDRRNTNFEKVVYGFPKKLLEVFFDSKYIEENYHKDWYTEMKFDYSKFTSDKLLSTLELWWIHYLLNKLYFDELPNVELSTFAHLLTRDKEKFEIIMNWVLDVLNKNNESTKNWFRLVVLENWKIIPYNFEKKDNKQIIEKIWNSYLYLKNESEMNINWFEDNNMNELVLVNASLWHILYDIFTSLYLWWKEKIVHFWSMDQYNWAKRNEEILSKIYGYVYKKLSNYLPEKLEDIFITTWWTNSFDGFFYKNLDDKFYNSYYNIIKCIIDDYKKHKNINKRKLIDEVVSWFKINEELINELKKLFLNYKIMNKKWEIIPSTTIDYLVWKEYNSHLEHKKYINYIYKNYLYNSGLSFYEIKKLWKSILEWLNS